MTLPRLAVLVAFLLAGSAQAFVPPANLPTFQILTNTGPEAGSLFLTKQGASDRFLMIVDHTGFPEYFQEMPGVARDLKLQPTGVLTYFLRAGGTPAHHAMDATYTHVDSWSAGHGQTTLDGHDFQILPNGNVLMFYADTQVVDMSGLVPGGHPAANVTGLVIHEVDPADSLVFEWRSWDHFEITDAVNVNLTSGSIDYVHCNSIEVDSDGHLLISSRHLDEITKIDRNTGDVLWRMGGSQNEFTLVGDTQWFTHQHSVRRTPAGTILAFDNGNYSTPRESRVVEYAVDEVGKVATLVWEFRNTPAIYAPRIGSAQRLPGGNTLISWGPSGVITEVRPDGTKAFEMDFQDPNAESYRVFKHVWNGNAAVPTLWAEEAQGEATLHFTKFGDPGVTQYNIYRAPNPNPTTLYASTSNETYVLKNLAPLETLHVRITAVDGSLNESPYSNELQIVMPDWSVDVPETAAGRTSGLLPGRPNPFAVATSIPYRKAAGAADLTLYDVRGRRVRAWTLGAEGSSGEVRWDGTDAQGRPVGNGVYYARLRDAQGVHTRTVSLVR